MGRGDLIGVGNKVFVIEVHAFMGSSGDQRFLGESGEVIEKDDLGLCTVRFKDGRTANFWNESQLEHLNGSPQVVEEA